MKEFIKNELFYKQKYNYLNLLKVLYFNINARFIFLIRALFWLRDRKKTFWANYINKYLITRYGCFIGKNAIIGKGISFPHPNGIIIGDRAEIGYDCIIYHQVTLGGKILGDAKAGNYPKIGNNVTIFAGAKIIGAINIGDKSIIGANSVVNKDVPKNTVVAGIPAKVIKYL